MYICVGTHVLEHTHVSVEDISVVFNYSLLCFCFVLFVRQDLLQIMDLTNSGRLVR